MTTYTTRDPRCDNRDPVRAPRDPVPLYGWHQEVCPACEHPIVSVYGTHRDTARGMIRQYRECKLCLKVWSRQRPMTATEAGRA